MRSAPLKNTEAAAYHEAAHALIASLCGHDVALVGLTPASTDTAGMILLAGSDLWKAKRTDDQGQTFRKCVETHCMYLLAGLAIDLRRDPRASMDGAASDFEKAMDLARQVTKSEIETATFCVTALIEVGKLLADPVNSRALDRIAKEIIERQRLSGQEVTDLINEGKYNG